MTHFRRCITTGDKICRQCWWLMVQLSYFDYRFINQGVSQQDLGLIAAKMAANVLIIYHFAFQTTFLGKIEEIISLFHWINFDYS